MSSKAALEQNFKQNYDPKIVERRREEQLKEQQIRREKGYDQERTSHMPTGKQNKSKTPTLIETYQLKISLQLSQWLIWRPKNLNEWFLVPCPMGYRCLVVAYMGRTEIYTKSLRRVCIYRSLLPNDAKTLTVLDCVHDVKEDVIYVLDAINYGLQDLQECEAEFRFFWLKCSFANNPSLSERSSQNQKPLKLLPHFDCSNEEKVREIFMQYPFFTNNSPQLAGYLFYHKDSTYVYGNTQLVGWIFPYMVKDVFDFDSHPAYEKPNDYHSLMQYVYDFDTKDAKKMLQRAQKQTNNSNNNITTLKRNYDDSSDDGNAEFGSESSLHKFDIHDIIYKEPPKQKKCFSDPVDDDNEPFELME